MQLDWHCDYNRMIFPRTPKEEFAFMDSPEDHEDLKIFHAIFQGL